MRAEHPNTLPPYDVTEWSDDDLYDVGKALFNLIKEDLLDLETFRAVQRTINHIDFEFHCRQFEAYMNTGNE